MSTNVFINLPVSDLDRSTAFYRALGAEIESNFSDENATCIRWDENVFFMLLTTEFFSTFTDRNVVMPSEGTQVFTSISRDSKRAVRDAVDIVLEHGGTVNQPFADHDFMVQASMVDPDGHIIEFMWIDPNAATEDADVSDDEPAYEEDHVRPDANDPVSDAEEEGWPAAPR
ncbi:VOC family protein [Microbacterium amylolyticum]|uniref:Lactoylglutathione lyase n=1 Tax=Microbacterium amylolyticum TaxID=936337 RepID=A0ABS4ZHL4_9MICO|nr:VOC family protein [Microbacterium amylolyticum]MBP2436760.1 putative lactoylglutathione lyase [Microbacterium amylolyticum]